MGTDETPEGEKMLDMKYMSAGVAALGAMALAASGYLTITTPDAQQCMVDLADAKARLELLTEAKDTCKDALGVCIDIGDPE